MDGMNGDLLDIEGGAENGIGSGVKPGRIGTISKYEQTLSVLGS